MPVLRNYKFDSRRTHKIDLRIKFTWHIKNTGQLHSYLIAITFDVIATQLNKQNFNKVSPSNVLTLQQS